MKTFKVICKADGIKWETVYPKKIVTRLFGLIKHTKRQYVPGPVKDEVCIVTDTYISSYDKDKYYILAGYPYGGGYNSKYFIKLDEFTETQKEIAKKTEPALN